MNKILLIIVLLYLSLLSSCNILRYGKIDESKINLSSDVLEVGEPENLGAAINTEDLELAPIISPDGKTLYFVRQEKRPLILICFSSSDRCRQ